MAIELFREDGYRASCEASVIAVTENGFATDQTVFYPVGGGQPGDSGQFVRQDGASTMIIDTCKDWQSGLHLHVVAKQHDLPAVGDKVTLHIDWQRRYRLMRMHSCMHMLCAVVPQSVTGCSIRDGSGRLDFDMPEPPDKQHIEEHLNRLIAADYPMNLRWISDQEMAAQPELVRTMSVQPPSGTGKVRLVEFKGADLQPCGGTHVASTAEIGAVRVPSIKSKGKQNRRITVEFA